MDAAVGRGGGAESADGGHGEQLKRAIGPGMLLLIGLVLWGVNLVAARQLGTTEAAPSPAQIRPAGTQPH